MMPKPLSRRNFLKILSVSGGSLAGAWLLTGCTTLPSSTPPPETAPAASLTLAAGTVASLTASPAPSDTPTGTLTSTPEPETGFLPSAAEGNGTVPLPAPHQEGGMPLMQALRVRHSTRTFLTDELPIAVLADLLWAAFGINRPQNGGRTAPSAYDFRDIEVYLAAPQGLFHYLAESHSLAALSPVDLRPHTGTQSYVAAAPLNLVYVSDYRRMTGSTAQCEQWSWAHSGFIAQNVYLYCASAGLACVVRSTIDREDLAARMGLDKDQHIVLAQTLGYPAT